MSRQGEEVEKWLRVNCPVIRNNVGYLSELCIELNSTEPIKILTDEDMQVIANEYVNRTPRDRWDRISSILIRRSNLLTIPFLIDIFEKTNNQNVMDAIAEYETRPRTLIGANRPSANYISRFGIASQNTQPNVVQVSNQALIQKPAAVVQKIQQPIVVIQKEKLKIDSFTINEGLLDQIQGRYPITDGSKGYALIINNINFDHYVNSPGDSNRTEGAMKDSLLLDSVLREKYGYFVQSHTDLNLKDMVKTIDDFKEIIGSEGPPHSIIVCIMSHGEKGDIVITTEKKEQKFLIYHAIDEFNNQNCPGLQDVPKIFLFQCCRGGDNGEAVRPKYQDDATPISTPGDSRLKLRVALHVIEYDIPGTEIDKNFGTERAITVKQICTFENILFKKKFYFPNKLT